MNAPLIRFTALLLVALTTLPTAIFAGETHIVEMRNVAPDDPAEANVFTPPILEIEVGDSVLFKVVDKGHNSASKRGMIPDGAEPWNGGMDEEVEITFTVEGTYGYICLPHYQMGMVGLILVGDHTINLKDAKKVRQRGGAAKAFKTLFEKLES
ncbi:MAG: pseudoazurin [Geminicoccaceae bacterium]